MRAFWRRRPPAERPVVPAASEAEVRAYADAAVYAGFTDLASAVEQVGEHFADEALAPARLGQIVRTAWAARAAVVGARTDLDDHARLARAFAALAGDKVLARMDFTCCQTCGHAEIHDERGPARDEDGYAFFHQQDTERIADGRLHLAYGTFGPAVPAEAVAGRVVERLRAAGLGVVWDGSASSRIEVAVGDWRRPLAA